MIATQNLIVWSLQLFLPNLSSGLNPACLDSTSSSYYLYFFYLIDFTSTLFYFTVGVISLQILPTYSVSHVNVNVARLLSMGPNIQKKTKQLGLKKVC